LILTTGKTATIKIPEIKIPAYQVREIRILEAGKNS